jgi:hypothetical protein
LNGAFLVQREPLSKRRALQQIEDIHDLDGAVLVQRVMRCGVSGV